MVFSISLYHQTERRTKFLRRIDDIELSGDATGLDMKKWMCEWMKEHTNIKFPEPYELKFTKDDGKEIDDNAMFDHSHHYKVIYTSWQTMLSNDAAAQSVETAFREAMSSRSVPSASSQPASSSDVPANPPVVEQSPSDGFQLLEHHMKHCKNTKGYSITFIQGEPHVATGHGAYMPWTSVSEDPKEFLNFIKRFNVVITHSPEDFADYDDLHALALFLEDFGDNRVVKLFKEVENNNVIDETLQGHEKALMIVSLMSHEQRTRLKMIADEVISSDSDASDHGSDERASSVPLENLFVPFSGRPMKLGGDEQTTTEPADTPIDDTETDDVNTTEVAVNTGGVETIILVKKNQNTVGFLRINLDNTTYVYHYPKSGTFKKVCDVFQSKLGISVGCVGMSGEFQYSLCQGQSVLTGYETITSFMDGRAEEHKVLNLRPRIAGGAKSVMKTALKSKMDKKTILEQCAKDLRDEVCGATPYNCQLLNEAKDYLKLVQGIAPKDAGAVFQMAVGALSIEDATKAMSLFDTSNKKTNTTEEKIEEFIKIALKEKLASFQSHAEMFEKAEQGIIASFVSLYGHFAQSSSSKSYDNSKLKDMLVARISNLKRDATSDASVDGMTQMFASASI